MSFTRSRVSPRREFGGLAKTASRVSLAVFAILVLSMASPARAVTVTLSPAVAGKTPEIVGYNSGHFMPGSNVADWWRFSNVNGARIFSTPTVVETNDDIAPFGDNVTSQATFV